MYPRLKFRAVAPAAVRSPAGLESDSQELSRTPWLIDLVKSRAARRLGRNPIGAATVAVLLATVFPLAGLPSAVAGDDSGAKVRSILAEQLTNVPGKSLTAVVVTYGPGGKSPKHSHAGSVFAYVLSGAIRSENSATGPAKVYEAGESFFEPAGSAHLVSENASATEPASLLAVFVADHRARLTTFDE